MADGLKKHLIPERLISDLKQIILQARQSAYAAVNACMISTYWKIGQRIVEEEQQGKTRAEYGKGQLQELAKMLTMECGQGFDARRLRDYRQFYLYFPDGAIWHSCVPNLTWTHFRSLLRVPDAETRAWYWKEATTEAWSVRTLDRNIGSQYYHRLLASKSKEALIHEMQTLTFPMRTDKLEFITPPMVAEFLGLTGNSSFTESQLEQCILNHLQKFLMELGKGYAFVSRQQHIATKRFFNDRKVIRQPIPYNL